MHILEALPGLCMISGFHFSILLKSPDQLNEYWPPIPLHPGANGTHRLNTADANHIAALTAHGVRLLLEAQAANSPYSNICLYN